MRRGFTLIELLIVMAILTVTMAIIMISGGAVSATQLSMASKDTLRLMRYARNMALQTQQPVTLEFAPGVIRLSSAFDALTAPPSSAPREEEIEPASPASSDETKDDDEQKPAKKTALLAGDIEEVGLTKHYEGVAFEFVSFNDSVATGRSINSDRKDFERRIVGEADEEAGEKLRQKSQTFSITIRANGTTRPFTIRVFDSEAGDEDKGNRISVDFLCTAKIEERD
jgi:prepilin-type N-terminal cleavage/methylation domain-containing protein